MWICTWNKMSLKIIYYSVFRGYNYFKKKKLDMKFPKALCSFSQSNFLSKQISVKKLFLSIYIYSQMALWILIYVANFENV